jgi:hypothetical protein
MFEFAGVCKGRCHMVGVENLWLEYRGQSRLSARAARAAIPRFILGPTLSTCRSLDTRLLGFIRRLLCDGVVPSVPRFSAARDCYSARQRVG